MKCKNTIAMVLAGAMLLPSNAFAADLSQYKDFPNDWSAKSLEQAIDDGLLNGSNGMIDAKGLLTRAQMAAIVSRSFGAAKTASLDDYRDVLPSAWYYSDMGKAVKMGAFQGANGLLNPDAPITREEAFTVLARAFALEGGGSATLKDFVDGGTVSSWASESVAALVAGGYVNGANGMLNLKNNITRAEFAKVITGMAASYVGAEGVSGKTVEGNVIVRESGASLSGMTINGDLIIADSADKASLDNVKVTGRIVIRGGADAVSIKDTTAGKGVLVSSPNGAAAISVSGGSVGTVTAKSDLSLSGSVSNVAVTDKATLTVEKNASVGTVTVSAAGSKVTGDGKVTNVQANANNVTVTSKGTKVTAGSGVSGVKAGDKTVEAGKTETVGTASTSSGGSSGGGSSSSSSVIRVSSWSELRAAVQRVEDGGTIQLATDISDAGNTNTAAIDGVSSATLPMESATAGKAFTLDGNGHIVTAASNSTYCFLINTGDSTGTTTVKNLTVDGGKFSKKVGGAFFVESGNVVFDGVTFKNCNAGNTGAFNGGGAICLNKHGSGMPNVTVTGCTFEDNYVGAAGATGRGGAIYANHGNRNPVTEDTAVMKLTVKDSTFKNNKAAYGGAIAADGNVDLSVTGCTFEGNEAATGADDIYIFDGVSAGKKDKQIYSNVDAVLADNTYSNKTDSENDMTAMNVILGRYYPAGYVGTPIASVDGAIDLTFSDIARTTPVQDVPESIAMTSIEIAGNTYWYGTAVYDPTTKKFVANFTANGTAVEATQIDDTNVYYYTASNLPESLYGTTALSYTDFYKADTGAAKVDAVSSATTGKYKMFENTDKSKLVSEGDNQGYKINGVTNVSVQVVGEQYVKAFILKTAGASVSGAYATAANLTLNENATTAPSWYKTLNADGTYGTITASNPVQVSNATAVLQTNAHWGDYMVLVTDPNGYLRNGRQGTWPVSANIQGIVVEATKDGQTIRVGLRHMKNIWVQVYEFAFDADEIPELVGATINKISYIVPENVYEYTFADGIYIKPAYTDAVTGSFDADHTTFTLNKAPEGLENAQMTVAFSVPKPNGRGSYVYQLYSGDVSEVGTAVNLTKPTDWPKDTSNGTYSVTISSSNYADITVTFPMTDAQRTQLTQLKEQAGALLTDYNEDTASPALKLLKSHYDEAVALLENEAATSDHATELINELPGMIQTVRDELKGNVTTKTGSAKVNNFNYTAQVTVVFNSDGTVASVVDNDTNTNGNDTIWSKLNGMTYDTKNFWQQFEGLNKSGVEALKINPTGGTYNTGTDNVDAVSGATYSSKAVQNAVLNAFDNLNN